ncbi:MAG: bifunctional DNA primase/polymerase, partial [Vulcanisaeta sp.]
MPPSQHEAQGVLDVGRGRGNLEISATGVNKPYSRWGNQEYREIKLLEAVRVLGRGRGLKEVIVDNEKRPVHKWRDASLSPDELEGIVKNNENAEGVAIIGDVLPHDPLHVLVILDVDDVDNGFKVLEAVFGTGWRERLLGGPDSFVVLTGPRPKDAWVCDCEAPGADCQCVNKESGETKPLSELERGLAIGVRVPVTCAPKGCIRGEAIEVRARNCYEVVFGRHPSGAFYQPVKWENNRFVGIELWQLGSGAEVTCEEFNKLLQIIKGAPVEEEEEVGGNNINNKDNKAGLPEAQATQQAQVTQAQTTPAPKSIKYRRLSEERKARVVEALKPHYKRGMRQNLWLIISGWGAWYGIHPLDIADVLLRLYKEAGDTDDLRMRGATIVYSYAKRGLPVSKEELAQVLGVEPYGDVVEPEKVSWKSLLKEVLGSDAEGVIKVLRRVVRRSLLTREERRKLLAMLRRGKTANAALIMTRLVKRRFRHIINPQTPEGADLGLHCWDGRRYKGCEKDIESFIARVYEAVVGDKTVRVSYTRLKDEALELLKDGARKVMPSEKALIAFENCVFDWEELQCLPHDPRHFVLHYIPHPLDQNALREALDKGLTPELAQKYTPKVLKATMEWVGDKWTILYEILGMILYPKPYKKAVLFIGPTDSGKSTCINLYKEVIGKENYSAVPLQSLTS